MLSLISENIQIIQCPEYRFFIKEIENEIKDIKDIPYLAVAICKKVDGIWTHDPHFKKQGKVKIYTNIDLMRIGD